MKSIVVFLFFALVFSLGTRRSLAFSGDWLDAGEQKKPTNILSRLINNDLLRFDYSSSSEMHNNLTIDYYLALSSTKGSGITNIISIILQQAQDYDVAKIT